MTQTHRNENCLKGFECPACHATEPFRIGVTTTATLYDEGVTEYENMEWDQGSYCECLTCTNFGTVSNRNSGRNQR